MSDALKVIADLLKSILVFEAQFKEEILAKAAGLDEGKLLKLKNILSEVSEWQKKVLTKKMKEDPGFYNKVAGARKKADQEIINLYKQKLGDDDRKKMEIILEKMKSL